MSDGRLLTGECYCRAVGYEVADDFSYALICHCKDCQRVTGSAFKPLAGIDAARFRVVRGEEHIRRFGDGGNYNAHCVLCGSLLYSRIEDEQNPDKPRVHVTLGTLFDPPSLQPTAHIFVRSKAKWDVIGDDLPQFETFPE